MNPTFSYACTLATALASLGSATQLSIAADRPIDIPDNLTLQIAAAPPVVKYPIMASLGRPGQLFVGDSSGVNLDKAGLEKERPHRILLLHDDDSNGVYDRSTVFADQMTFPQGGVWLDGSFYVASPPGIWKLTDTNHDGVADRREMLVDGFEYTGNAADVHGPFLHPNGRLYWCHGRKGHEVRQRDGTLVHSGLASGVWSCRPDGSDVRWHALACADNPTEIDFTPEGEIVGTVNLYYANPRGDTLVHWLRGGVYERADQLEAIAGLPRTLETMPIAYNFGHVAVSGCAFYRSGNLDPSWRGQLFVVHFNTQRITRMECTPEGASYRFTEHEFLKVRDPDAHLTDVLEDRDGSLLVVNTGGWFRRGCPSSMVAKLETLGAIYRIRAKASSPNTPPPWDQPTSEIWGRARRATSEDVRQLVLSLQSSNASIARASANALATLARPETFPPLVAALSHPNPGVKLAAAHALGEIRELPTQAISALIHRLDGDLDPAIEHQLLHALRRPEATGPLTQALRGSTPPSLKRRALTVLDALPPRPLKAADVLPWMDNDDAPLAQVAANILAKHREWMPDFTAHALAALPRRPVNATAVARWEIAATPWLEEPCVRDLVAALAESRDRTIQQTAWRILAHGKVSSPDTRWIQALVRALSESTPKDLPPILDAAANLNAGETREPLEQLSRDPQRPLPIRLKALSAALRPKTPLSRASGDFLIRVLREEKATLPRIEAARCLAKPTLSREQMLAVAELIPSLSPLELRPISALIPAATEPEVGLAFSRAMASAPGLASFQESEIRTLFSGLPPECFARVAPALREAASEDDLRRQKLERLPGLVRNQGRAAEGQAIFESGKGACSACHRVGDIGNTVGPNLSTIGAIRTERDLLESILFPSATLARDYEARAIEMLNGDTLVGVVSRNSPEGLLVHDATGEPHEIPRGQIAMVQALSTSLMPPGLERALTEEELLDLVAFLRSRR